jgi:hypothetical protein
MPKYVIGNGSLHEIINDNGIRVVNFVISKNLIVKSTMFPHRNILKFTQTCLDEKTHNQVDHTLTDMRRPLIVLDVQSLRKQTVILITMWWWQK